jgi:hypothetical protein
VVISHTTRVLRIEFRLAGGNGKPLAAKTAAALARAGQVEAKLAGPAIRAATARCTWKAAGGYFTCAMTVPAHVRTGRSDTYAVTATEQISKITVAAPAVGRSTNPLRIRFRAAIHSTAGPAIEPPQLSRATPRSSI